MSDKRQQSTGRKWQWLRRGVQVLALLLFLYLLLGTRQDMATFLPHDLFFRLDPLAGISAMLASRSWLAPLALGAITLLLTLALGRAWCGWLCPLGTVLDWIPTRRASKDSPDIHRYWRHAKNLILFAVFFSALLGSLTLLIFDPVTLLFRSLASVVLPALASLITITESWLYGVTALQPAVEWFDGAVRGWLLLETPFFLPNLLIAGVFAAVLALNAIRARFWCRYLCPLGALLGLVSRLSLIRYSVEDSKCTSCKLCASTCHTGAIDPERKFRANPVECTSCLECVDVCPTGAIAFTGQVARINQPVYDLSRRELLASLGVAALVAALLRAAPVFARTKPQLVRPPGADEERLSSTCIRCGECLKVCPTGGLQPGLYAAGHVNLWTPSLVSRHGYCDYSCNSCGQVCPTGAIPKLSLDDKRKKVIGVAYIDEKRCIPFAEERDCIVCEEMCPVPEKAVVLEDYFVLKPDGTIANVRRPKVVKHLCIGCGICEYQCPVNGESAIPILPPEA